MSALDVPASASGSLGVLRLDGLASHSRCSKNSLIFGSWSETNWTAQAIAVLDILPVPHVDITGCPFVRYVSSRWANRFAILRILRIRVRSSNRANRRSCSS